MQFDCKLKFSIEKYKINVNILGEKKLFTYYSPISEKNKRKEIRKKNKRKKKEKRRIGEK